MVRVWSRFAAGLVLGALVASGCADTIEPHAIDLRGEHRFRAGDNLDYAAPDFDDSNWEKLTPPASWRLRILGGEVFGWHRMHFDLEEPPTSPQALELGPIAWSDEVFVNGQRVGATGRMDQMPRMGLEPRLYALPAGSLRPGKNVVAIRVRALPFLVCGLLGQRHGIDDALVLERRRSDALLRTQLAEGLLFGFLGLSLLLVAFFPKRGRHGRATQFLLATIPSALAMLWLLSTTMRSAGISPEAAGALPFAAISIAGISYGGFICVIATGGVPRLIKRLMLLQGVIAVLFLAVPGALGALIVAGSVNNAVASTAVFILLFRAVREGAPGARPTAAGAIVVLISYLAMFLLPDPFFAGIPFIYYGIACSMAFAVLALIRHIHEMSLEIDQKTEYSLEAHRVERNRLARDLHDGLGQMLALLKMQMQRMGRKHTGDPVQDVFDESAEQVGATLDELRRIAQDLRPAPLQDRTFDDAVRDYARAIESRTDFDVEVSGTFTHPPTGGVADELYRITQECLTNCLKHSAARKVEVTLAETGDRYLLVVEDDGRGLSKTKGAGLGLATIRERTELLGGKCAITSGSDGGTRIEVRVPRAV